MQTSGHRNVRDKAWKITKNPPIFLLESVMIPCTPNESASGAVVAVNNIENPTQNSQSHNVQNVVANLNHSPTLNFFHVQNSKTVKLT